MSCGNRPGTNRRRRTLHRPGDRYDVASFYNAIRRACDQAWPAPEPLARMVIVTGKTRRRVESLAEWKSRLGKNWAQLVAWRGEHRWHPHQLRHTAATELRREHGLEAAQVILGHKDADCHPEYTRRKNVEAAKRVMAALVG